MGLKDFTLQVYQNVYASTTLGVNKGKGKLLYQPAEGQVSGLSFGTALPGGFVECSFVFQGTLIDALRWKFGFTSEHLDILQGGEAVYYGIIEDMDLDQVNATVQVTARGYYVTLDDQRYDTSSTTSETFRDAVHWLLSQQGASKNWRGYFLDDDLDHIEDTGTTVQRRTGTTGLETPREALEMWAALGDSSNNRYWPAVWDTRLLHVAPEQTETKWYVRLDQLSSATLSSSRQDIWNHVTVSYQDISDNTRKLSTPAQDSASQERHGLRQLLVTAGELATTAANQMAATILARTKDVRDRSALVLKGSVYDRGMCERPLWLVRAGDIIEAVDLQIPDRPVGEIVLGLNKWMIRETVYDVDGDTLTVAPDQDEASVEDVVEEAIETAVTLGRGVAATGGGSGTVTSVGLAVPSSEFSVSGSPVTTSGTLTIAKQNQLANTFWAGPSSGGAVVPSFRFVAPADLPAATTSAQGAVELATSAETTAGLAVQASDTRLSDARPPNGAAGGHLYGSFPDPVVGVDPTRGPRFEWATADTINVTCPAATGKAYLTLSNGTLDKTFLQNGTHTLDVTASGIGGVQTGASTNAASTGYYIYAQGTAAGTLGYTMVPQGTAFALESGYTYSKLVYFVRNGTRASTTAICKFFCTEDGRGSFYAMTGNDGDPGDIVSGGTSTTPAAVDLTHYAPLGATLAWLWARGVVTGATVTSYEIYTGSAAADVWVNASIGNASGSARYFSQSFPIPMNALATSVYYAFSAATAGRDSLVRCRGWRW